tara:strand:- start:774 stop:989 length:216 start_codon:yes stop_codon:yes gene_type:complete
MSKMGNFNIWFEQEGYDYDDEKSVQKAYDDYMQTQEYQREHDQQSRKVADSLEEQEKLRELEFAVLNEGKL